MSWDQIRHPKSDTDLHFGLYYPWCYSINMLNRNLNIFLNFPWVLWFSKKFQSYPSFPWFFKFSKLFFLWISRLSLSAVNPELKHNGFLKYNNCAAYFSELPKVTRITGTRDRNFCYFIPIQFSTLLLS